MTRKRDENTGPGRLLAFYRTATAVLALAAGALAWDDASQWWRERRGELGPAAVSAGAPNEAAVRRLIDPLRYNGLPALLRPDVSLSVDFGKREWRLLNIHRFDEAGRALLDEGKYGVCGQLAAFTHENLQSIFDHRYQLRIVRAAESAYFPASIGTHYVIRVTDVSLPLEPKVFILDPSFRRYGPEEDFDDYRFYEALPYLRFVQDRGRDEVHPVNSGTPIMIRKQVLLNFAVHDVDGRFDPENFSIVVAATKKHAYTSRLILAMRVNGGKTERMQDAPTLRKLLKENEQALLTKQMAQFMQHIKFSTNF